MLRCPLLGGGEPAPCSAEDEEDDVGLCQTSGLLSEQLRRRKHTSHTPHDWSTHTILWSNLPIMLSNMRTNVKS